MIFQVDPVLVGLLTSILTGTAEVLILLFVFLITIYRYIKTNYIQFLYLSLEWLALLLWQGFTTASNMVYYSHRNPNFPPLASVDLATVLGYLGYFSLLFGSAFLILFVDSISRMGVDPFKAILYGIFVGLGVYAALLPGQQVKFISDLTFYVSAGFWAFRAILWTYYSALLTLNSPNTKVQRYAMSTFIGSSLVLLTAFFITFGLVESDHIINEVLFLFSVILQAIPLYLEPKLLYILPYRASSITVVNDNGLPLFTYRWVPEEEASVKHDILFGSLMHGISGLLKESLGKGNIREIALEDSILLLYRHNQFPITFVLVSTKSSKSLVQALQRFAIEFTSSFGNVLEVQSEVVSPSAFQDASRLVESSFPFLPEFS
ncbi:MAG: hypothetical protein ACFFE8_16580 [Candidatus Heimdallarchaeota archaeon]